MIEMCQRRLARTRLTSEDASQPCCIMNIIKITFLADGINGLAIGGGCIT
jgi:hypothetical protein